MTPYRRPATLPSPTVVAPVLRGLWPAFLAVAVGSLAFTLCTARDESVVRTIDHGRAAAFRPTRSSPSRVDTPSSSATQ